jgi:release factor glutamine methyltransferase
MTVGIWLKNSTVQLKKAGIATARLDCLVLLEDELKISRSSLLANSENNLTTKQINSLNKKLRRRAKHEPLAYIRGKSEFYGHVFEVNQHTLQPRPETETLVDLTINYSKEQPKKSNQTNAASSIPFKIIDVGTGSGCIAISLQLEFKNKADIYATDIDHKCLETAQRNATTLKANVSFYQGNLLEPLFEDGFFKINKTPSIIVANLPYVPGEHTINKSAMFEPKHAIFGGADGLKYYRQMFNQISKLLQKPAAIITESLPPQHQALAKIAEQNGYQLQKTQDFIQLFTLSN